MLFGATFLIFAFAFNYWNLRNHKIKGTKTFFSPSDYIQFLLATKVELVTLCGSKDWLELFIFSLGARGTSNVLRSQSRLCVRQSGMLACVMRSCWELLPCCAGRWRRRSRRRSGRPRRPRPRSLRRFGTGPARSSPRRTPTPQSRTLWGKGARDSPSSKRQQKTTRRDVFWAESQAEFFQFKMKMCLSWGDSYFFWLLIRKRKTKGTAGGTR